MKYGSECLKNTTLLIPVMRVKRQTAVAYPFARRNSKKATTQGTVSTCLLETSFLILQKDHDHGKKFVTFPLFRQTNISIFELLKNVYPIVSKNSMISFIPHVLLLKDTIWFLLVNPTFVVWFIVWLNPSWCWSNPPEYPWLVKFHGSSKSFLGWIVVFAAFCWLNHHLCWPFWSVKLC